MEKYHCRCQTNETWQTRHVNDQCIQKGSWQHEKIGKILTVSLTVQRPHPNVIQVLWFLIYLCNSFSSLVSARTPKILYALSQVFFTMYPFWPIEYMPYGSLHKLLHDMSISLNLVAMVWFPLGFLSQIQIEMAKDIVRGMTHLHSENILVPFVCEISLKFPSIETLQQETCLWTKKPSMSSKSPILEWQVKQTRVWRVK